MPFETIQRDTSRTLTVTLLLAMLMLFAAGCSDQQSSAPEQTQMTDTPAAQVAEPEPMVPAEVPEPAAEAAEPMVTAAAGDGEPIYQKACKACHEAGVANAPKLGDSAAWAPRIEKGNDALLGSVKNGLNAMPPMGGCMTCSDAELSSAIAYMTSQ